ncbi:hypothetical protein E2C01_091818 [Portunus trituberculatus]|uniref:Uncharacterized protein n=1 Tax=Portunus trituberculatus TaxID=210409 RepID=A0A5B7JW39_PORTR|nr:hypothetical protein [Portunus trituberculatus]
MKGGKKGCEISMKLGDTSFP